MTIRLAAGTGRALRTLALWLGLAALMIQSLAPFCLPAEAAPAGGNTIVICTSHGTETITLGADGKPTKPAGHHKTDCSLCTACPMGGGFIASSSIVIASQTLSHGEAWAMIASPASAAPAHFFYVGRAPPRIAKRELA